VVDKLIAMTNESPFPLTIRDDPGVILDCLIVALVRYGFKVKLNVQPTLIVEPYSDGNGGKYGKGYCHVNLICGDLIYVIGDEQVQVGPSKGSWRTGKIFEISLQEPDAFERLAKAIHKNLTTR
jgi:hypothetical protein